MKKIKTVRRGLRAFGSRELQAPFKTYGKKAFDTAAPAQQLIAGRLVDVTGCQSRQY